MGRNEELHSNWRALATIHLPLKRFVRAGRGNIEKGNCNVSAGKYEIQNVDGKEIKQFYEDVLQQAGSKSLTTRSQAKAAADCTKSLKKLATTKEVKIQPFALQKYFRLATENQVEQLKYMEIPLEQLDACDCYGWSALMMAACAGAYETVQYLLELGANKDSNDKTRQSAWDLAKKKQHLHVQTLLEGEMQTTKEPQAFASTEKLAIQPFYCEACQRDFREVTPKQHYTSTLHRFNEKSTLPGNKLNKFNIPAKNRGLQLMLTAGWDRESGLGPSGRLYPIKTVLRKRHSGLGISQAPARVTHYQAFDARATQRNYYKSSKKGSRNDMKNEKQRNELS